MSSLTPEQRQNIRKLKAAAQRYGASPRELKALLEAASVESNFRHLSYGDRDSQGILQQRPSQGWGSNESVETDAGQFLAAARKVSSGGFKGSAGKLAQAVQRSAFPGRYDERAGLADQLAGGSSYSGSSPPSSTPTGDPEARQRLLLAYLSDRHNPDALLQLGYGLKNLPQTQAPSRSGGGYDPTSTVAARASSIDAERLPYKWGGGHQGKAKAGEPLDCSGAVSRALGINPRVSGEFESWGKPGEGGKDAVTVYANKQHVFLRVGDHYFGTSASNPGGGAGWIPRSQVSAEYLRGFTARHQ